MNVLFLILTLVVVSYTVVVMAAILSTWLPGIFQGKVMRAIHGLADPWLKVFSHLKFLKLGKMDFTVLPALMALQIFIQVFYALASREIVTFGLVLGLLVEMIFASLQMILVFFIILAGIRFVGIASGASSVSRLWMTLDHLLQPVVFPIIGRLSPHRVIPYGTALAIFTAGLCLLWFLLGLASRGLSLLCRWIPF